MCDTWESIGSIVDRVVEVTARPGATPAGRDYARGIQPTFVPSAAQRGHWEAGATRSSTHGVSAFHAARRPDPVRDRNWNLERVPTSAKPAGTKFREETPKEGILPDRGDRAGKPLTAQARKPGRAFSAREHDIAVPVSQRDVHAPQAAADAILIARLSRRMPGQRQGWA